MVNSVERFETLTRSTEKYIQLADETKWTAKGACTVIVNINLIRDKLSNVHYIATLKLILISCSQLDEKEVTTTILTDQCRLFQCDA